MAERPGVLVSADVAERHGDRIEALAPGYDLVVMTGGAALDDADLARVEIAFFSADLWPDRVRPFFGAAMRAPHLRWFHSTSAGVDNPIFGQLLARGTRLTTSSGAAAPAIARTVIMDVLALSRRLPELLRAQGRHEWAYRSFDDVEGQRIGVAGMGPIGLDVIRLASALGMEPIGMRRRVVGDEPCETWPLERFGELAATVDVLVLALPSTPETVGLLSADVIATMAAHAVVVNVGRGDAIDETALAGALAAGRLGGAGLDVFATEPLPADSPLWDLPNVIVTPHNSAATDGTRQRAVELFLGNLAAYVAGRALRNEVVPH